MVKKKSILKDALREIKLTKKRFLSLLLIITIGTGFYVGLKSTSYDMQNTAENYYKETNLFDVKITSSSGFLESDIEKLKNIDGVNGVMLSKTLDVITNVDNEDYVIRLNSLNDDKKDDNENYINRLILTDGNYPKTINEGLVEESFLKDTGLKIGDLVTLEPEDDSSLRAKKIKIVGTVKSSYYSSKEKGTSNLKNGKVNYYMYLDENDFSSSYYSYAFLTLDDAKKYGTYTNAYENHIKSFEDEINKTASKITEDKSELLIDELNNKISQLQNDLYRLNQSGNSDAIKSETDKINAEVKTLENEIAKIQSKTTNVSLRTEEASFYEYKLETQRIESIAKIFPLIFFLVSALVSLTSMTRIVEEERVQMGTLRALGYSKFDVVFKYILYAFLASFIGSILGSLLFYKAIPLLVAYCYASFYDMPALITTLQMNHVLFASVIALLTTILATIFVFVKDTLKTPASLMRPEAPKNGKRILLEKVNFIWKKLSFLNKVTFRNLFRYKKRLFMTIIGILGCTSLLLAAFGIKDSVNGVVKKQINEIDKYDMQLQINENLNEDNKDDLIKSLNNNKKVNEIKSVYMTTVTAKNNKDSETSYLIVPENNKKLDDFISLKDAKTDDKLKLSDDGVIISEKLSNLLNKKKNDTITLIINAKEVKVKIKAICENYIEHYVYLSKDLYKKLTEEDVNYNSILMVNKDLKDDDEEALAQDLSNLTGILSVNIKTNTINSYKDMMATLNYVALILIVSAAALAFVVLYNLSSVNISERKKELATIKVLGFYDGEVTNYINKENIILTIIGSLLGLIAGSFLTYYVIKACETNQFMFSFSISILSYILSLIMTLVFLFIVNIFMHYDLKKLDMVEALKNYE